MKRIPIGARVELTMAYGNLRAGITGVVYGRHWIYAKVKLDDGTTAAIPTPRLKELKE